MSQLTDQSKNNGRMAAMLLDLSYALADLARNQVKILSIAANATDGPTIEVACPHRPGWLHGEHVATHSGVIKAVHVYKARVHGCTVTWSQT